MLHDLNYLKESNIYRSLGGQKSQRHLIVKGVIEDIIYEHMTKKHIIGDYS